MIKHVLLTFLCLLLSMEFSPAQDKYGVWRHSWMEKAEKSTPELVKVVKHPVGVVRSQADSSAFQGWRMVPAGGMESLYQSSINDKNGIVVDFGEHVTGYFTFTTDLETLYPDAPVRLKFTFAEVPAELNTPFDPYPGGLSRAWLQDEIVTVSDIPSTIAIPRRLSFRYVKIEAVGQFLYKFKISDMQCEATTSATNWPDPLPGSVDPKINRINEVGLNTLKECMQTVFEDGPKRDRRLWIGDLYLEALANMYSFKNHQLTKHCLYVLAALSAEDGLLYASTYERPYLHRSNNQIVDYSLLYNVALLDYLNASGDRETALDLWPVVKQQIAFAESYLDEGGIYNPQKNKPMWIFFDWTPDLNTDVAIQGALIYSLQKSYKLAKLLGKEKEVSGWPVLASRLQKAIRQSSYDKKSGLFYSGKEKQLSYVSQIWMILSGTLSPREGAKALTAVQADQTAVYPGTPYAWHYLVEALIACGMNIEAKNTLLSYWGGMVDKGADTFWEVYDPNDDYRSPYNFFPINSYCHAWSCTPVYFINRYPEVFLK